MLDLCFVDREWLSPGRRSMLAEDLAPLVLTLVPDVALEALERDRV